jgi:hypothetical protein
MVAAQGDYTVDWRFISLRMINSGIDYDSHFPAGYEEGHTSGLRLLRVAARARAEHGRAGFGPFYEAVSSEIFDSPGAAELTAAIRGSRAFTELLLARAGLPADRLPPAPPATASSHHQATATAIQACRADLLRVHPTSPHEPSASSATEPSPSLALPPTTQFSAAAHDNVLTPLTPSTSSALPHVTPVASARLPVTPSRCTLLAAAPLSGTAQSATTRIAGNTARNRRIRSTPTHTARLSTQSSLKRKCKCLQTAQCPESLHKTRGD